MNTHNANRREVLQPIIRVCELFDLFTRDVDRLHNLELILQTSSLRRLLALLCFVYTSTLRLLRPSSGIGRSRCGGPTIRVVFSGDGRGMRVWMRRLLLRVETREILAKKLYLTNNFVCSRLVTS